MWFISLDYWACSFLTVNSYLFHMRNLFYQIQFCLLCVYSMFGSKLSLTLLSEKQELASTFIFKSSRKNFDMHFHTTGGCKYSMHSTFKIAHYDQGFPPKTPIDCTLFLVNSFIGIWLLISQVVTTWDQGLLKRSWVQICPFLASWDARHSTKQKYRGIWSCTRCEVWRGEKFPATRCLECIYRCCCLVSL